MAMSNAKRRQKRAKKLVEQEGKEMPRLRFKKGRTPKPTRYR